MFLSTPWVTSALLLLPTLAVAQIFTGTVVDAQHQAPLPYASIGVKGKPIGGIADAQGHFYINITKASPSDSLIVSYLGYRSTSLLKRDISQTAYTVKLPATALQLQEVVALGKRELLSFGNKNPTWRFTGWGDYTSLTGRLRGIAIEPTTVPLQLVRFTMHLKACEFDSVRFRLHILPLEATHAGNQQAELLTKNIFFTARRAQKWVSLDLLPYALTIDQRFIVAVEWVDSWVKKEAGRSHLLEISTSREAGYTYIRETPEEPFQVIQTEFTPTMYVEAHKARPHARPLRPMPSHP